MPVVHRNSHWINAFPGGIGEHIDEIVHSLAHKLGRNLCPPFPQSVPRSLPWIRKLALPAISLVACLAIGILAYRLATKCHHSASASTAAEPPTKSLHSAFDQPAVPPPPDLTGNWQIQTETKTSTLNRYCGLWLTYNVGIVQKNWIVFINGEKHREMLNGVEHTYVGQSRTRFEVQGALAWKNGSYILTMDINEGSLSRETVASKFRQTPN